MTGTPAPTLTASFGGCCAGATAHLPIPHWLHGDGDLLGGLLVFSTRAGCDGREPGCPVPGPVTQILWRAEPPGSTGSCPFVGGTAQPEERPGPCTLLLRAGEPLEPLDVDDRRVVVRRADGSLALTDRNGILFGAPIAPGPAAAAALAADDLVVLTASGFEHRSPDGALRRVWPLEDPSVTLGGRDDAAAQLRLLDAARGHAVYLERGVVKVLRLADGRRTVVGPGTDARLEDRGTADPAPATGGLVYAYDAGGEWPGRIRLVPFDRL